jgi:hypothetical protein
MTYHKTCGYCGNAYTAQRTNSLYCSDNCRISAFRAKNREHQGTTDCDTLKIDVYGNLYRVKVFENVVRVERQQPHADNLEFDLSKYENLYSTMDNIWNLETLNFLLRHYELELRKVTKSVTF